MENELLEKFQQRIGYTFTNSSLLHEALSHPSLDNKQNYQRLEFLGDKILGSCVAQLIFKLFPNETEGALSIIHANLVNTEVLSELASTLEIERIVKISPSVTPRNNNKKRILENVLEAIIAAICIDSNTENSRKLIEQLWIPYIKENREILLHKDIKTLLQEHSQMSFGAFPVYELLETSGKAHIPIFKIKVSVSEEIYAIAEANSKKAAEKKAAKSLLNKLKIL